MRMLPVGSVRRMGGIGSVLTVVVAMVTGTEAFSVSTALLTGLTGCIIGLRLAQ